MIKILIVDDEKIIRKAMAQVFKRYGDCLFAESGLSALTAVVTAFEEGDPFDLIILDISMEDKSGLDILKEIRILEKKRNIKPSDRSKIIMATGNQKLTMVKACIAAGCDNYIVKPLKPKEIIAVLEKIGIPPLIEDDA
ncbi:MAG: response regulator [Pseudomonadota bacterium]